MHEVLRRRREAILREFQLFTIAAKSLLPESQWGELVERFEQLLNEAGLGDTTPGETANPSV